MCFRKGYLHWHFVSINLTVFFIFLFLDSLNLFLKIHYRNVVWKLALSALLNIFVLRRNKELMSCSYSVQCQNSEGNLKTVKNLLTGRHGNIICSTPSTQLASGSEIPRKVCLLWGHGRTAEPAKPLFFPPLQPFIR